MSVDFFIVAPPMVLYVLYLVVAVVSGMFIGATGIGGVLLVPLLLVMDVPVRVANTAVLASLFFAGLAAIPASWKLLPKKTTLMMGAAVVPGAMGGSLLFPIIPSVWTSGFMAALSMFAGTRAVISTLRDRKQAAACSSTAVVATDVELSRAQSADAEAESAIAQSASATTGGMQSESVHSMDAKCSSEENITSSLNRAGKGGVRELDISLWLAMSFGAVIGFCSVLTSTGGPFIAIPLLFHTRPDLPPALVIAMAQALCVPIGLCAAVVAAISSTIDLGLGLTIGLCLAVGVPLGVRIAQRARPAHLKIAIGVLLIAIGLMAAVKVLLSARSSVAEVPNL